LISKKFVSNDVCHLFFSHEDSDFTFTPGQYAILNIPSSPTPLKRLYSFAGTNMEDGMFDLLIKLVPGGIASEYVRSLKVGECVDVSGPAGLFCLQKNDKRKIFMATGTGIAPIRSFLSTRAPHALNSLLFWGLKDFVDTYLIDELLSLKAAHSSFAFYCCFSRQTSFDNISSRLTDSFKTGHIDSVWQSIMPGILPEDEYYLCGSRVVIESLRIFLLSKGVEKRNLFFEKY